MLSKQEYLAKLNEAIAYEWEAVGSIREAFGYMLGPTPKRCDPDYKANYDCHRRADDRYRFFFGSISSKLMAERLVKSRYVEFMPGVWGKKPRSN